MSSGSRKGHGVEATDLAQHGKLETVSLIGGESSVLVLVSVYNHLIVLRNHCLPASDRADHVFRSDVGSLPSSSEA